MKQTFPRNVLPSVMEVNMNGLHSVKMQQIDEVKKMLECPFKACYLWTNPSSWTDVFWHAFAYLSAWAWIWPQTLSIMPDPCCSTLFEL